MDENIFPKDYFKPYNLNPFSPFSIYYIDDFDSSESQRSENNVCDNQKFEQNVQTQQSVNGSNDVSLLTDHLVQYFCVSIFLFFIFIFFCVIYVFYVKKFK